MSEVSRDLVLRPNEFAYILDSTKGLINIACGPYKVSLSNSDFVCTFDEESKRFVNTSMEQGIQKFVVAPNGWYIQLKNPAGEKHPTVGTLNSLPELEIGKKVNIPGGSFALYPGQMAKVIQGHTLHSNQYLLARVYDSEAIGKKYVNGQLLVIKGTEVKFYIPPTGIEVLPTSNGAYVRNAVTLERLEYCILKNEQGEKKYVHGPAVVFPEPDEIFIINQETKLPIFKAIELSSISGIYCKVISDFDEEIQSADDFEVVNEVVEVDGEVSEDEMISEDNVYTNVVHHKAGEELFITGENVIFYPRPELSIISYEDKIIHHAIAIPEGEGRYVLERLTGKVKTVYGPKMFLPDPRYEVIVKRKLTKKECELWYPGNQEVIEYNCPEPIAAATLDGLRGFTMQNSGNSFTFTNSCLTSTSTSALDNGFYGQENVVTDKSSGFNRGNTYTKPRTIVIDNKFDGVVSIDVWSGYAVNVVSKDGKRRVELGPKTVLLEYDETLEVIDNSVFLRVDNDRIMTVVNAQTKDFVNVGIKLSYCVSFDKTMKDKWFTIEDYKNYLVDYERSLIKKEIKKLTIEEFYNNATDFISGIVVVTDTKTKKPTTLDNGMYVTDVEVLEVEISDPSVRQLFDKHQAEIVAKTLQLSAANKDINVTTELAKIEREKADITYKNEMYRIDLNSKIKQEEQKKKDEYTRLVEASHKAEREAEKELQTMKAAIAKIELAAAKEKTTQEFNFRKESDKMDAEKEKNHTDAIKKLIDSVSPDLVAAIQNASKSDMVKEIAQSLSPYALASESESVSDVVNKLLRGTGLDLDKIVEKVITKE